MSFDDFYELEVENLSREGKRIIVGYFSDKIRQVLTELRPIPEKAERGEGMIEYASHCGYNDCVRETNENFDRILSGLERKSK